MGSFRTVHFFISAAGVFVGTAPPGIITSRVIGAGRGSYFHFPVPSANIKGKFTHAYVLHLSELRRVEPALHGWTRAAQTVIITLSYG